MVSHPADYHWSSYRVNALGEQDTLIKPHPLYEGLGLDLAARQAVYRDLFHNELESTVIEDIRRATNGNFVLGNASFAMQISSALGKRVVPGKAGRPRRAPGQDPGKLLKTSK
jgi:putative transposase